jgi:hypothetical protein
MAGQDLKLGLVSVRPQLSGDINVTTMVGYVYGKEESKVSWSGFLEPKIYVVPTAKYKELEVEKFLKRFNIDVKPLPVSAKQQGKGREGGRKELDGGMIHPGILTGGKGKGQPGQPGQPQQQQQKKPLRMYLTFKANVSPYETSTMTFVNTMYNCIVDKPEKGKKTKSILNNAIAQNVQGAYNKIVESIPDTGTFLKKIKDTVPTLGQWVPSNNLTMEFNINFPKDSIVPKDEKKTKAKFGNFRIETFDGPIFMLVGELAEDIPCKVPDSVPLSVSFAYQAEGIKLAKGFPMAIALTNGDVETEQYEGSEVVQSTASASSAAATKEEKDEVEKTLPALRQAIFSARQAWIVALKKEKSGKAATPVSKLIDLLNAVNSGPPDTIVGKLDEALKFANENIEDETIKTTITEAVTTAKTDIPEAKTKANNLKKELKTGRGRMIGGDDPEEEEGEEEEEEEEEESGDSEPASAPAPAAPQKARLVLPRPAPLVETDAKGALFQYALAISDYIDALTILGKTPPPQIQVLLKEAKGLKELLPAAAKKEIQEILPTDPVQRVEVLAEKLVGLRRKKADLERQRDVLQGQVPQSRVGSTIPLEEVERVAREETITPEQRAQFCTTLIQKRIGTDEITPELIAELVGEADNLDMTEQEVRTCIAEEQTRRAAGAAGSSTVVTPAAAGEGAAGAPAAGEGAGTAAGQQALSDQTQGLVANMNRLIVQVTERSSAAAGGAGQGIQPIRRSLTPYDDILAARNAAYSIANRIQEFPQASDLQPSITDMANAPPTIINDGNAMTVLAAVRQFITDATPYFRVQGELGRGRGHTGGDRTSILRDQIAKLNDQITKVDEEIGVTEANVIIAKTEAGIQMITQPETNASPAAKDVFKAAMKDYISYYVAETLNIRKLEKIKEENKIEEAIVLSPVVMRELNTKWGTVLNRATELSVDDTVNALEEHYKETIESKITGKSSYSEKELLDIETNILIYGIFIHNLYLATGNEAYIETQTAKLLNEVKEIRDNKKKNFSFKFDAFARYKAPTLGEYWQKFKEALTPGRTFEAFVNGVRTMLTYTGSALKTVGKGTFIALAGTGVVVGASVAISVVVAGGVIYGFGKVVQVAGNDISLLLDGVSTTPPAEESAAPAEQPATPQPDKGLQTAAKELVREVGEMIGAVTTKLGQRDVGDLVTLKQTLSDEIPTIQTDVNITALREAANAYATGRLTAYRQAIEQNADIPHEELSQLVETEALNDARVIAYVEKVKKQIEGANTKLTEIQSKLNGSYTTLTEYANKYKKEEDKAVASKSNGMCMLEVLYARIMQLHGKQNTRQNRFATFCEPNPPSSVIKDVRSMQSIQDEIRTNKLILSELVRTRVVENVQNASRESIHSLEEQLAIARARIERNLPNTTPIQEVQIEAINGKKTIDNVQRLYEEALASQKKNATDLASAKKRAQSILRRIDALRKPTEDNPNGLSQELNAQRTALQAVLANQDATKDDILRACDVAERDVQAEEAARPGKLRQLLTRIGDAFERTVPRISQEELTAAEAERVCAQLGRDIRQFLTEINELEIYNAQGQENLLAAIRSLRQQLDALAQNPGVCTELREAYNRVVSLYYSFQMSVVATQIRTELERQRVEEEAAEAERVQMDAQRIHEEGEAAVQARRQAEAQRREQEAAAAAAAETARQEAAQAAEAERARVAAEQAAEEGAPGEGAAEGGVPAAPAAPAPAGDAAAQGGIETPAAETPAAAAAPPAGQGEGGDAAGASAAVAPLQGIQIPSPAEMGRKILELKNIANGLNTIPSSFQTHTNNTLKSITTKKELQTALDSLAQQYNTSEDIRGTINELVFEIEMIIEEALVQQNAAKVRAIGRSRSNKRKSYKKQKKTERRRTTYKSKPKK